MERAVNWLSGNLVSGPGTATQWFLPLRNLGARGWGGGWRSPVSRNHLCNEQLPQSTVATSTAHVSNVCEYCSLV